MPLVTAQRAFAFTDGVGVNTHLNWQDAGLSWGNFTLVKNCFTYLGVKHARDGVPYAGWTQPLYEQLADMGIKWTILMNRDDYNASGNYNSSLDRVQNLVTARAGSVACIEGANEINNWELYLNGGNTHDDLTLGRPLQEQLWNAVHARPALAGIPIANLTLGGVDYETARTKLGDMGAWADFGTWHTYFNYGNQPRTDLQNGYNVARVICPNKQVMTTECGYYTAIYDDSWATGSGVSYDVQARLTLNMLVVHHQIGGKRAMIYELLDNNTDLNNDQSIEDSLGIFEGNGNPKPAATGVRNLLAALSDTGTNAATFTVGALDYTLTDMPASGQHMLFQKSDGTFHIVIWAEPDVWNQNTRTRIVNGSTNVTVTLAGPATNLTVRDPLSGSAVTTTNSQSVVVPISDYPMVVSLTGTSGGTGGGTGGTGTSEPITLGIGPDSLVLKITQDAHNGSCQYTVAVDGVQIGGTQTAVALRNSGSVDTVTVKGSFTAGNHTVTINFLNDIYDGTPTSDRNLYLESATINGAAVPASTISMLSGGPTSFTFTKVALAITALLPAMGGKIMIGRNGLPLLSSVANVTAPPPPITAVSEPAAPAGWGEVFFDSFRGVTLDRNKWQILFGGSASKNGALQWDHGGIMVANGLTIRTWLDGTTWRSGGIGQGNSVTAPFYTPAFNGYGDFQFSIRARLPKGKGVGAVFAAWPWDDSWPPEFDLLESPGTNKDSLLTTWHWVGNNTGVSKSVPLDLTQDHVYTARRTAGRWNYWVDGTEIAPPTEWAQNPDTKALNVQLSGFVALAGDSWYGGAPDNTTPSPYDVHVSWVRVVAPGGGALSTPPDEGIPVPVPTSGLTGAQIAANFLGPLTVGLNIERGNAWKMSYNGQSLRTNIAYWQYLKGLGITHVRMFMAFRPDLDMLGQGFVGNTTPDNATIDLLLDSCSTAISAGLKVFLDLTDVISDTELNTYWSSISAYLDRAAQRIAGRASLTPDMFCVGAFQELAAAENSQVNGRRLDGHNILRARLPNHILLNGSAYWNEPYHLTDGTWTKPADTLTIAQWHLYPTGLSATMAQDIRSKMAAFSTANSGIPTVGGEAGFNNAWEAGAQNYSATWLANMRLWAEHCGQERPMWWAVTDGNDWRANRSSTDPTLLATIEDTTRACDLIIRGQSWFNPLPYPGT